MPRSVSRGRSRIRSRTALLPRLLLYAATVVLAVTVLSPAAAVAAPVAREQVSQGPPGEAASDPSTVDPERRDEVLFPGWRSSGDLAWTTDGDSTGFHLLVADARSGYTWRTAATLAEPSIETDRWIGNACLTESGRRAVVVYAPRHFTNRAHLFDRGAFAAVVDLSSGAVTKLGVTVSLAYYDPGCGLGETAVLTQSGATDLGRTRLHVVDTAGGEVRRVHEIEGEVTSAVPARDGIVAARGGQIVRVDDGGAITRLVDTRGTAIRLHPDAGGGIVHLQRDGDQSVVTRFAGGRTRELGRGPLTDVNLVAGTGGRVFITGSPRLAKSLPAAVTGVQAPAGAEVSTEGGVTVQRTAQARTAALTSGAAADRTISLRATVRATGAAVDFVVSPVARPSANAAQGLQASKAAPDLAASAESPSDPVDRDRTCSVARNDSRIQVYQPHWSQVEWAAELAVQKALNVVRPANWKHSGAPAAWRPQEMFPPIELAGGGRVPAQVLLGVLAQESNLWQASFHVAEGVTGNPLVGSFYGVEDGWGIDWSKADCGYGVAQVTDGMRRTGPGTLAPEEQLAVAVDYATNIAAGVRILQDKWNQVRALGVTVNGGDPARIESWFAALWAYNSGINPQASTGNTTGCTPGPNCTDAPGNGPGGNYGLGWSNNPARPDYPFNRTPFLDKNNYDDARHPQHWPYPEKVIGWAAYPIVKYTGGNGYEAGYKQAWWTSEDFRTSAKPPVGTFCSTHSTDGNRCDPNNIGTTTNPCRLTDSHCWWHASASWKHCSSSSVACGYEARITAPGTAEPPDADASGAYADESRNRYRPRCALDGLPQGTLVVDDVPDSVPSLREGCTRTWASRGRFDLNFARHTDGLYHSKVDFHQIGGGFGGHFWFSHTRTVDANAAKNFEVTGTWTLDRSLAQWARVLVHLPDHGAHTQQGTYTVNLGNGETRRRSILQKTQEHRWVSLGAFPFAGTPSVSLSSITGEGDGTQDIAFDAVAFVPLPRKPAEQMVVLGDSYASGEGAGSYYQESDDSGTGGSAFRNGCHRSRNAWSRQAVLPDTSEPVGTRADRFEDSLDYHLLACSGAQTEHLLPSTSHNARFEYGRGSHKELSQLDRGFLDGNTTTVVVSVGGNDAHFADVLKACTVGTPTPLQNCADSTAPNDWFNDPPPSPLPLRAALPKIINEEVKASVDTVLRDAHSKARNARIVVMGYPRLFPLIGDGTTSHRSTACKLTTGLNDAEIDFLNDMADLLNDALHETAFTLATEGVRTSYSDPRTEFELTQVCSDASADPESIHRVVADKTEGEDPSATISQQSFHPKRSAADRYAAAFVTTLNALTDRVGPPAPPDTRIAAAELHELQGYSPGNPPAYVRRDFGDWRTAVPGCDTREVVLRRDSTAVQPATGCPVTGGTWFSRYDLVTETDRAKVPIDHLVALKDAWISGAHAWSSAKKQTFANDLEHPQLIAVSRSSNSQKQDRSPDQWLPDVSYQCTYAKSWIHVKRVYHLAVTPAEHAELKRILTRVC